MYRIEVKDMASFKAFLTISDMDYVDVFLTQSDVTCVLNTNEVFARMTFQAFSSTNEQSFTCRIPRKLLLDVLHEGYIELSSSNDSIEISFFSTANSLLCEASLQKQDVFSEMYSHKMELALRKYEVFFDGSLLKPLYSISRICNGVISVDSGVACATLAAGARVYRRIKSLESFCITPYAFACLVKCNTRFFNVENYLGAVAGDFTVLVKKARGPNNQEFHSICGESSIYGAKYKAEIDLANLLHFVASIKPSIESLSVSVKDRRCFIELARIAYKIPISISEERFAKSAVMESFHIPLYIVSNVLNAFPSTKFQFAQKRTFVQLEQDDFVVLF